MTDVAIDRHHNVVRLAGDLDLRDIADLRAALGAIGGDELSSST